MDLPTKRFMKSQDMNVAAPVVKRKTCIFRQPLYSLRSIVPSGRCLSPPERFLAPPLTGTVATRVGRNWSNHAIQ